MNRITVIVGSTTIDTIIQNGLNLLKIGGVTAYAGYTFQRLGFQTKAISNIAPSDRAVSAFFIKNGIELLNGQTPITTRFVNHYTEDGRLQQMPFHAAPIQTDVIAEVLKTCEVVHFGPLHPEDIELAGMKQAYKEKRQVLLDIQGYVRRVKGVDICFSVSPIVYEALSYASYVKAEATELEWVLKDSRRTVEQLIERYGIAELVVTCGERGGYIATSRGRTAYGACPAQAIVDPTGAGDVFFAAYSASRIYHRKNIEEACRFAAFLAAEQICGNYIPFDALHLN
ncbi:MAG: PfkB family carbohydrate kinase [Desulfobacterales bacterium]